jgi:hypothetical protein
MARKVMDTLERIGDRTRWVIFALAIAWMFGYGVTHPKAASLPVRPDAKLTPGAVLTTEMSDVCTPGWATAHRDVSEKTKREVFARYGLPQSGAFEVDHLISLQLGGSNDVANLWPQSYGTTPYNAHVKDALEQRLHALVCRKEITLKLAQQAIASDWIAAYRLYVIPAGTGGR